MLDQYEKELTARQLRSLVFAISLALVVGSIFAIVLSFRIDQTRVYITSAGNNTVHFTMSEVLCGMDLLQEQSCDKCDYIVGNTYDYYIECGFTFRYSFNLIDLTMRYYIISSVTGLFGIIGLAVFIHLYRTANK